MYQKLTLDNNLRLIINELPHTRSVTTSIYVATGARYEAERVSGISHFIEHMLFKGTTKRPTAQEIAVAIEGIGGFFNASTGQEITNYWVKVAYQHFETGLDVLSDMLRAPLFDPTEIEKERRVIIQELRETFDTPEELVFFDLDALMWLPHPLGRDVAGSPESVAGISRDDMLQYLAQHYHADNLVVSVAGFVQAQDIVSQIAEKFSPVLPAPRENFARFGLAQSNARVKVRFKKTEQAHVAVSTWAYDRNHPDRYAVSVLNTILGDGMSSRLFQEIREKRGLAYSVSSFGSSLDDCGYFGSYAAVEPKNAAATLAAMLAEWGQLASHNVPEHELNKAKELIKGGILLSMEDTHSIAGWYGRQEALRLPILTADQVTARIDAVTADDVQRVARDIFRNEWLNLAVVGPFKSDGKFITALHL
ncbi:MAG: insulinase family protein [Chloroflexota bacterium]|nr:MAG: insulinase family protein [Chloroflexota bacterium]